ncbi:MAG: dienelactone hydrolase family protein [Flavitalea sp.]
MKPQKVLYLCACVLIALISCKKDLSTADKNPGNNPPGNVPDSIIETVPATHGSLSVDVNANCAGYYYAVPERYDSSTQNYPLILFIHGIGELGNGKSDLVNMTRAGLPRLINKNGFPPSFESGGEHFSFIVVAPQFKKWPTNADVNSVLQYAIKKYRIDESRIYMAGLSMGGGVTWNFSAEFGGSLAAVVPICGGSNPDNKRAASIAAFNLPVWAFHNEDDPTVPVSFSRDYVSKINSYHPAVAAKLTTWKTGGHDSWTKAFDPATKENGMNMYEWMLQYKNLLKKG